MELIIRHLGLCAYSPVFERMKRFTAERGDDASDELWFLQHLPVFTLGQAGRHEHVRDPGRIPVLGCDRGGQVTFHGPGQVIVYTLVDLARRGLGVRAFVSLLEQAVIDALAGMGIDAGRRAGAPGVYVGAAKIAALGLRVRRGCSYHGVALNVDVDLEPFTRIDPCGFPGLDVTRVVDLRPGAELPVVGQNLLRALVKLLDGAPAVTGVPEALALPSPSEVD